MQIHELNNFGGSLGTGSFIAVDNGNDTGKLSTQALLSETKEEIEALDASLNGRIDNIIAGGDAPSEAEIIDARRGADGVNYNSLGTAIRTQVNNIQDAFTMLADEGYAEYFYETILNKGFNRSNGTFPDESGWDITSYIPVKGGEKVYIYNGQERTIYNGFYKSDYSYIEPFDVEIDNANEIIIPEGAAYMVLSNRHSHFDFRVWIEAQGLATAADLEKMDSQKINSGIEYSFSILNERVKTDGEIVTSINLARTDYIPCQEGQAVKWFGWSFIYQGNPSMCCLAFYNAKKEFISGITKIGDETVSKRGIINTVAPNGTAYVIGSTNDDQALGYVSVFFTLPNVFEYLDTTNIESEHNVLYARHIIGSGTPLTLLHFSDLHADIKAMERIVSEANNLVDDMICTGDIVANTAEQISSWWDEDVMIAIGNHDTASYSGGSYNWTALSMADRDAYYIAPFESNWGITHTPGTSYYYKDYATQKIRLIVMDGMLYTDNGADATTQTSWLASLLSDAISNSYHVIIAIHAPHGGATAEICSFSKKDQGTMPTWTDCNTPQSVIDTVSTAIGNGLKFIGYIVGHTHQDNMWDAENNGKQLMYCVTCANTDSYAQWKDSDQFRDSENDAYNIVTIDTTNTLVKIVRGGGADIDNVMRTRKAICFNYSTGEIVGEVL